MRQFSLEEQRRRKREGDRDQQRERMRNATEEQRQAPGQAERKDRSQKPLIGLKILRQKRHGIVTEHASYFFTLEKFNMADGLLLFMHGNCNIISL